MLSKTLRVAFASCLMMGTVQLAHATPVPVTTFNLGTVYTGNIPDGTPPWLTATFTPTQNCVVGDPTYYCGILTLTSNLTDADFVQGGTNSNAALGWGFYLDGQLFVPATGTAPAPLSVVCLSGTCANSSFYGTSTPLNSGPVPGPFNFSFSWLSSNRFTVGDSASYLISFDTSFDTSPFGANPNGWTSVAHVQGITGGCSGWIVSGDGTGADGGTPCVPTNVPEPSDNLGMAAFGLAVIVALVEVRRRRGNRSNRKVS